MMQALKFLQDMHQKNLDIHELGWNLACTVRACHFEQPIYQRVLFFWFGLHTLDLVLILHHTVLCKILFCHDLLHSLACLLVQVQNPLFHLGVFLMQFAQIPPLRVWAICQSLCHHAKICAAATVYGS